LAVVINQFPFILAPLAAQHRLAGDALFLIEVHEWFYENPIMAQMKQADKQS